MTRRPPLYRPRLLERVEVVWKDAQHDSQFDGDPAHYKPALALLTNIGYFVRLTRDTVTLASCRDEAGTSRWYDDIPRVLVREIRSLEPTKEAAPEPQA